VTVFFASILFLFVSVCFHNNENIHVLFKVFRTGCSEIVTVM